ncbi:ABC transporter permease [Mesorhizobium sp. B1-1-5]|uniref:ABC transporter permease n=1 Tax=Mesorhizobium sp. B1-1-5 TaxID=2589979 RepID=UPI001FF02FC7|nr:ABC transporter permease [Mesorhizobium sp. B1-1-5]
MLSLAGRTLTRLLSRYGVLLGFLALWQAAASGGWVNAAVLPPIDMIVVALWKGLAGGSLLGDIAISLQRAGLAFAAAATVAIPLGLVMGQTRSVETALDPILQLFRQTSALALYPVFILLLGLGEASKVFVIFWATLFPLLLNTISGVKSVDPLLIKAARSMGTSDFDLFRKVILPASMPSVVAGARLAVKSSLFAVIGAEMLAAKSGLGFLIQNSQLMMETADMYAGILTLTVIGLTVNYLLVWFERWATAWKGQSESSLI